MEVKTVLRNGLRRLLTGEDSIELHAGFPSWGKAFADVDALGLYLHIPFCRQICPYCPYNKTLFERSLAERYANAVCRELSFYAEVVGERPVTSFYIGGGTPTTMLTAGLERILRRLREAFRLECDIHLESHPNDLTPGNLDIIESLGVRHLSVGVEALQDRHLRRLGRPYTAAEARGAVERAVGRDFRCVNADFIFALPHQTRREVEQTGRALVDMGVDQVAAYPLFEFPYTSWPRIAQEQGYRRPGILERRQMLRVLEGVFYGAGYERTSVWAFTRTGVPKYCSVTVPLYIGVGASGTSYLRDVFYLNTFNVGEYVGRLEAGEMAIALKLDLSTKMQMAGWLYWRIYETRFRRRDFERRFGVPFDDVYGWLGRLLSVVGWSEDDGEELVLTDEGTYWLHTLEDLFSIDYIGKLWGMSAQEPWPERVAL
jgi:coproporphyrinogen III oxidase-like Fe-S oxidoreductase